MGSKISQPKKTEISHDNFKSNHRNTLSLPSSIRQVSRLSYSTGSITPLNQSYSSLKNRKVLKTNGITGIYLSQNIARIVVDFWRENIDPLSMQQQLEVGSSILFGMTSMDNDIKQIIKFKLKNDQIKTQYLSLKFLDNFGYLTRNLLKNDINLFSALSAVGVLHKTMGLHMQHFQTMLEAIHETFSYFFADQYDNQSKYAVAQVFTVIAKIMTGAYLDKLCAPMQPTSDMELTFVESLEECLKSPTGRECLFEYLKGKSCDNIALFLELLFKFKWQLSDKHRYVVARDIVKRCILPNAVNKSISVQNVNNILEKMRNLERSFLSQQDFMFEVEFFDDIEYEIYQSIMQNYWTDFVLYIKNIN